MEIPNRSQYDAAFSRKLARLSAAHRRELYGLLGNPPNIANVPQAFWDKVKKEDGDAIAAAILLLFWKSFEYHAELARQPLSQSPGLTRVAIGAADDYARRQAAVVASDRIDSIRDRIERKAVEDWHTTVGGFDVEVDAAGSPTLTPTPPLTRSEVLNDILKAWPPASDARVAVTETTAAQTAGGEAAINRTVGISGDDVWRIHPELSATGTCPICRPLDGRPRRIWGIEYPLGPPSPHSNCNCEIIYANINIGELVPA